MKHKGKIATPILMGDFDKCLSHPAFETETQVTNHSKCPFQVDLNTLKLQAQAEILSVHSVVDEDSNRLGCNAMSAVYNYRRFGETKRRHLQSQEAQF
jgi:hypothetical protein